MVSEAAVRFKPRLLGIIIIALVVAAIGAVLVMRYAEADLQRDMSEWKEKLNLIADNRANSVSDWVGMHFSEMGKLAANPALRQWMQERTVPPADLSVGLPDAGSKADAAVENAGAAEINAETEPLQTEVPSQMSIVTNLLTYAAGQLGFMPTDLPTTLDMPEDGKLTSPSGMALLDNQNHLLTTTPYFNSLDTHVQKSLERMPAGMQGMIDIYRGSGGEIALGFVQPVIRAGGYVDSESVIGRIVGVKTLPKEVFTTLLQSPPEGGSSLEALLVRTQSGNIAYLTPTKASPFMMGKEASNDPDTLAGAYAVANPGEFFEKPDVRSVDVLATGRAIVGTPWTLVVKIDREEALQASNQRRQWMVGLLIVLTVTIAVALVAVWYIASARRSVRAVRFFRALADAAQTERHRFAQLVEMLIHMVDRRDPYAANHSQLVSRLAVVIGEKLGLDTKDIETLKLSGLLMNVGKMIVPEMVLTKQGALDGEEKLAMRRALAASAELLGEVELDQSIAATIRGAQERMNGNGPEGIKGDKILLTARILAVVNAFVSMTSPRAYREALAAGAAITILRDEAHKYDVTIVAVLDTFIQSDAGQQFLAEHMKAEDEAQSKVTLVKR